MSAVAGLPSCFAGNCMPSIHSSDIPRSFNDGPWCWQDTQYRPLHPIGAQPHQSERPSFLGSSPLADGASTLHTITARRVSPPYGSRTARSGHATRGGTGLSAPTDRRQQHGMLRPYAPAVTLRTARSASPPIRAEAAAPYHTGIRRSSMGSPSRRAHWAKATSPRMRDNDAYY